MIGIAAPSYDVLGTVIVPARVRNPYAIARRATVTATLDGGVSVYDGGYSVADQLFEAQLNYPSATVLETVRYLIAAYPLLIVSTETGCYSALVEMRIVSQHMDLRIRIVELLSGG